MDRRASLKALALGGLAPRTLLESVGKQSVQSAAAAAAGALPPGRPNMIFIFIDDMGYGDLGCYGNRAVETPNIDRLAAEGTRFTQFYANSPICSPSRVACTTGQYPARWRINSYIASSEKNRKRDMANFLDPEAPSLARTLKEDGGYATAHFGKWHMGGGRDVGDAPLPQAYGFDESLVSFEGLGDRVLIKGQGLSEASAELGRGEITWVEKSDRTEIYVDRTLDFIRRHPDQPFYINLWPGDVHDPYDPEERLMEKYEAFSCNKYMQQYLAVIDALDRQIGRLLDALAEQGLEEDTLIVLASDNGPTAWPRYYKEGYLAPGKTAGLRGRKWSLYEGGIREPFIVRWKGRVPAGQVNDETVMAGIDLFPTLCRLAKVPLPEGVSFDGVDMSRAMLGATPTREAPLMWEYGRSEIYLQPYLHCDRAPNLAIREGNWKLLVNADGSDKQLYDLAQHPYEEILAESAANYPDVASRLTDKVLAWRRTLP